MLELRRELGDRAGEAHTRYELAIIDAREGKHERARRELLAVLELWRELGDHAGETAALAALASLDGGADDPGA